MQINQKVLMNIIHLYAEQYGWTSEYILNNVYLDEHILHQDIIKNQKQQDLTIKTNLTLLPMINDKERKKLVENLNSLYVDPQENRRSELNNNTTLEETTRQIEEAKRKLANM